MGFVPLRQRQAEKSSALPVNQTPNFPGVAGSSRFSAIPNEDFSQATKALYERELARGVSENEEIFTGEESVSTGSQPQWANKYRPRKPRYFNRVQMGYEWNKYNQTHYDHDNPPPKVVQGYKFNIFYPDLIDKTKAPTYRIEREHGRKRGQSFAAAGEEDTCLIRFMAGPPYEDIAFRIVDKEWDYSAKRERGFKSTFDKVDAPIVLAPDSDLHLTLLTQSIGYLTATFSIQTGEIPPFCRARNSTLTSITGLLPKVKPTDKPLLSIDLVIFIYIATKWCMGAYGYNNCILGVST